MKHQAAKGLTQSRNAAALRALRKGLLLAVVVAAVVVLFRSFDVHAWLGAALEWMKGLGPWSYILFVAIFVAATMLFIPGAVLCLGAGALFGVGRGSLLVSLATTLAATLAFLLGRHLARGWVAKKLKEYESFAAIDRAVAKEGWKIVFLTRLSPIFPFALLNYGFGLTRVRLRDYVLATWIGTMPATVLYAYLGTLARDGFANHARTPTEWALLAVGLLATVAVAVIVTRIARRALAKPAAAAP